MGVCCNSNAEQDTQNECQVPGSSTRMPGSYN
jgi:hypothetical protein